MNRAIFFDRDGVVNYRLVGDYVRQISEFKFIPDFFPFFKRIKAQGYLAIIISNQQGVGKGLMTQDELEIVNTYMQTETKNQTGFNFDDIYVCTDLASSESLRRKPNPGMINEAIDKWDIDFNGSWMIGDSEHDVIAGHNAKVKSVLIKPEYTSMITTADIVCSNLLALKF